MKRSVVVIGSGLAGTLICNELGEKVDVTLLEIGSENSIQYPKVKFVRKKFAEVKTFCYGGGGTTNLWHNGLIPIHNQDISSLDFQDVLNEAKPYTDRAASKLYFMNRAYETEYDNVLSELNEVSEKLGVFRDGIDCLLYPKKFKKLGVIQEVNAVYSVTDIDFVLQDHHIVSINYCIGSKKFSISPDIVVVSAGALGTPLMIKKIHVAAGQSFEQVGKGLIDHPLAFTGKVKFKKGIAKLVKKLSLFDKGDYECRTIVRLKSDCGRYTCGAFFRPALTMENKLPIYKYKSLLGASSGMERIKNAFSLKLFRPDILAEIYSHVFGFSIGGRIYNILLLFEQKRGNHSVFYSGSDLNVDWCITEEELAIYNQILLKLKSMLSELSDDINIQIPITEEWLWSAAHHSGTISMGRDLNSLIDKDLRLKLCDNVYVCDGSVIQEHSYANTGLTIGQLSIRLAEKILS